MSTNAIATCSIFEPERAKYARMWTDVPDYRRVSFGEQLVGAFLAITSAKPGQRIVDVGCGPGRAALKFAQLGMEVTAVDLSRVALDPAVAEAVDSEDLDFVEACLWRDWPRFAPNNRYAYCCDVLEHIPTEFTMLVAANCLQAAERAFLHINFDPDTFGRTIGEPLHLTVQPFAWWRDRLAEIGKLTDARDMLGHGLFMLERP